MSGAKKTRPDVQWRKAACLGKLDSCFLCALQAHTAARPFVNLPPLD